MIRFTKMHGIGNDYIYVDAFAQSMDGFDLPDLSRRMSDRHTGVGADGLILLLPPEKGAEADVRMRMFNADGSEAEMCGNGVRCVCKFAHDHGLSSSNPMRIQTGRGVLSLSYTLDKTGTVDEVTVDMGEPILDLAKIPVDVAKLGKNDGLLWNIPCNERTYQAAFVSMGNPHAIMYLDRIDGVNLPCEGPALEAHPAFPNRMNVHFVQVHSPDEVTMKTWERGSGATLACGTGAAAVCVAGVLVGFTRRDLLAHLPGGDLRLRWDEKTNHVLKTGPAVEVFTGEWVATVARRGSRLPPPVIPESE